MIMRNVDWNCLFSRLGKIAPALVLTLSALRLAGEARGADGLVTPAARPIPIQVVSAPEQAVIPREQGADAPPESLPGVASSLLPLAPIDAQIVEHALQRPQPATPPIATFDQVEAWQQGPGTTRLWGASISSWEAPALCHRPLYFEDENLERHGRSFGLLQPAASAVHFAGRAAAWPYLAGAFSPHECIYTLGRERPGSCADYRLYRPPVSLRGAVYQGAAVTGLSFVVP
jgi:hypothetical protein